MLSAVELTENAPMQAQYLIFDVGRKHLIQRAEILNVVGTDAGDRAAIA
jgi:hypothetical protein